MSERPETRAPGTPVTKVIQPLLLTGAAVFLALHALHLNADFPNHSPWMDWAKYTDEGWYGDAAIRHFQRGHWYVAGDFNPAAALPVWPLLEALVFRVTGVSLAAARALTVAIFTLILICSYLLVDRWQSLSRTATNSRPSLAPAITVLLLAVSPFCYAFTRMAILEPLVALLTLMALLAASYAGPIRDRGTAKQVLRSLPIIALGLLLPLMVLTKTTAIFLVPSIAWILWARAAYRLRPFLTLAAPAATLAFAIWLAYYGFIVRPHFLSDYHYLFSANAYTGITPSNALAVLGETIADGHWIGKFFYPLSILAAVIAVLVTPRLLRNPLVPALLLWASGYAIFLAYHDNLQPRYYLVVAIPLILLVPTVLESVWNDAPLLSTGHRIAAGSVMAALALVIATDARQTLGYVRHPEYSFTEAASEIHDIVARDRTHNPLVLSISGSNLSLMTGLPSICDDFGTMDLAVRVRAYQPGWYVTWNQVDDDKMDALTPTYHLERVAAFPAMDDPERNLLILYRLDPAAPGPTRRRHKPSPHLVRTAFGQVTTSKTLEP
jgi:hypothetical protein